MDELFAIFLKVLAPFLFPVLPQTRFFGLYLLTAVLIAYLVYRQTAEPAGRRPRFFDFLLPKDVYLHRSALVDYRFFFVNHISFVFLVAPMLLSAPFVARIVNGALESALGASPQWGAGGIVAMIVYTVAIALAFDFGIFIVHTAMHRVPALWEFHKVHHSAEVLTPVTVYRVHPVEDFLYGAATGALTGSTHGVFDYAAGETISTATVLNVDAALFAFYLLGYNLRHSHIWFGYPGWLSHILVSPAQHQIHHSTHQRHLDTNMGFMFAIWDWVFGTLYVPKERETLALGLGDPAAARDYDGVIALYLTPFRNLARRWRAKWLAGA